MRKLLNTLYVTTQGSYLSKEGLAIHISVEGRDPVLLPSHNLSGIVCIGRVSCSPYLMQFCAENGILISFLDENGRFLARVEGPVSGNVYLRREQYRAADSPSRSVEIVRLLLCGKLANSRAVLRRYLRDHDSEDTAVCSAADRLKELIELLRSADSVDRMRGLEGKGADIYFSVFDRLRTRREDAFRFDGRSRRPPLDRMNALLSFAYTLLLHEVIGALESVGLDPAAGFLHCDRPGRASLALDLLEEYRAPVADRFVLSLVNNRRIAEHDFRVRSNGAVLLTDAGRKTFLSFWQQRKKDELEHGFIGEKISLGLLFFIQARIMAKYLRGEIDSYVPYIWK